MPDSRKSPTQIIFRCPGCNAKMSARIESAGKAFPCPRCKTSVTVPAPFTLGSASQDHPIAATADVSGDRGGFVGYEAPPKKASDAPFAATHGVKGAQHGRSSGGDGFDDFDDAVESSTIEDDPASDSSQAANSFSTGRPDSQQSLVEQLPKLSMEANWKLAGLKLPNYLVRGRGAALELVVNRFISSIQREKGKSVNPGVAADALNMGGSERPLRIAYNVHPGHATATDVYFRAQGNDLYVRFKCIPRTQISYLRMGVYAALSSSLFLLLLWGYLYGTGAFHSWMTDYATKLADSSGGHEGTTGFCIRKLTEGYTSLDPDRFCEVFSRQPLQKVWSEVDRLKRTPEALAGWQESDMTKDHPMHGLLSLGFASSDKLPMKKEQIPGWMLDNEAQGGHGILYSLTIGMQTGGAAFPHNDQQFASLYAIDSLKRTESEGEFYTRLYKLEVSSDVDLSWYVHRCAAIWLPSLLATPEVRYHEYDDLLSDRSAAQMNAAISRSLQESTVFHGPWSPIDLMLNDPKLFFMNITGPGAVIGILVGGLMWVLPSTFLNRPCRFLGWPTPEEFNNNALAHNAWVERVLSDTLLQDFGVQEGDKFTIHGQ